MSDSSPFKRVDVRKVTEIDIETLFKDLKNRSHKIRDLFAHQADILRDYEEKHIDTKDVGLELPTGSGKTLVGLLIGEWKRKIFNKRVLYLCPTKQLAYQVHQQSKDYGITTNVFVGSKYNYNSTDLMSYRTSKNIAISTYSGLFNVSPGLYDPQIIILDDAHGAETYIGSMWSLNINRQKHTELYDKILETFETDLPPHFIRVIHSKKREFITHKTEKVSFGAFFKKLPVLREILNSHIDDTKKTLFFSWGILRDGLVACHVYISYGSILIRPYIPPTLNHKPFANAEQRIYMSATLGRGGELERITGINKIQRIPTPKTYEKRGVGRRLFIFPDYILEPGNLYKWVNARLSSVDRTLVLCPNRYKVSQFQRILDMSSRKLIVLSADHIEETMMPFTNAKNCLLLLANRYDGLDLPDGVCRQIIIDGLPSGTNLQEVFLEERLGLDVLLKERIKTRIQQAAGRCTRSDADSAAVIMLDRRLLDYCARRENQDFFHPEIRTEIRFFFEQEPITIDKIDAILDSFMNQDENWEEAEENIAELRSYEEPPDSSVTDILANVVKDEVNFSYAMWTGNYEKAIICGRNVTDALSGLKLAPYRALWYYFVSNPATILSKDRKEHENLAHDFLIRAKEACGTISWFPNALRTMLPQTEVIDETIEIQALAVEGVLELLKKLGTVGQRFHTKIKKIEELLNESDPDKFDRGLVELGTLLGFSSFRPTGSAPPDAAWSLENHICFVFEGKSNEAPEIGVTVSNCRQTTSHSLWVAANENLKYVKQIYPILVGHKTDINVDAVPFCGDIYLLQISEILNLFDRAKRMLIDTRALMTSQINENLRLIVLQNLIRYNLTPDDLSNLFTSNLVSSLPIKSH